MYTEFVAKERRKRRFATALTWIFAVVYLALLVAPIALHVYFPEQANGDVTLVLFAYVAAAYGLVSIVLATKTSFDAAKNNRQNDLVLRLLERQLDLAERRLDLAERSAEHRTIAAELQERSIELGERSTKLGERSVELAERSLALQEASARRSQRPSTPMTISLFPPRKQAE